MNYKVCILAAGKNKDVSYAEDFPICLLPIGTKSALTNIIERFPKDIEIIIATGYKKELIRDFVKIAHEDRKIIIMEVDFESPGTGPGTSLLACKQFLNSPFIFTSADTIVSGEIPEPNRNWIGVSQVSDSTPYCMADVENDYVTQFYDKIDTPTLLKTCKNYKTILNNAFIGMAGIYDYETFWDELEKNQNLINNQLQVSNGLSSLIKNKIETIHFFNWFDIGKEAGYNLANRFFEKNKVIVKPDEFIYFEARKVIKYFKDKEVVQQRIQRAEKLKNIVPEIIDKTDNFYSYYFIEGKTLPKINDIGLFKQFLNHCNETIWKKHLLNEEEQLEFKNLCKKVYYDKSNKRIEKFFRETKVQDKVDIINGERVPTIKEMFEKLDWENLYNGIPVTFHGDTQPENIIICDKGFQLIDWRHNFAGNIDRGDIYYDLSKLYHALIVTHEVIRKNQFEVTDNKTHINFDFMLKNNLLEYKDALEEFIKENNYDLKKVKILTALTFLNIAPLHHYPYNIFLYYLGKYSLHKELKNNNNPYKQINNSINKHENKNEFTIN